MYTPKQKSQKKFIQAYSQNSSQVNTPQSHRKNQTPKITNYNNPTTKINEPESQKASKQFNFDNVYKYKQSTQQSINQQSGGFRVFDKSPSPQRYSLDSSENTETERGSHFYPFGFSGFIPNKERISEKSKESLKRRYSSNRATVDKYQDNMNKPPQSTKTKKFQSSIQEDQDDTDVIYGFKPIQAKTSRIIDLNSQASEKNGSLLDKYKFKDCK